MSIQRIPAQSSLPFFAKWLSYLSIPLVVLVWPFLRSVRTLQEYPDSSIHTCPQSKVDTSGSHTKSSKPRKINKMVKKKHHLSGIQKKMCFLVATTKNIRKIMLIMTPKEPTAGNLVVVSTGVIPIPYNVIKPSHCRGKRRALSAQGSNNLGDSLGFGLMKTYDNMMLHCFRCLSHASNSAILTVFQPLNACECCFHEFFE